MPNFGVPELQQVDRLASMHRTAPEGPMRIAPAPPEDQGPQHSPARAVHLQFLPLLHQRSGPRGDQHETQNHASEATEAKAIPRHCCGRFDHGAIQAARA